MFVSNCVYFMKSVTLEGLSPDLAYFNSIISLYTFTLFHQMNGSTNKTYTGKT